MSGPGRGRMLVIAAGVAIAATVAAALLVTGLPDAQRQARLDERRVQDLHRIDLAIRAHARQHDALPATLDGLGEATGRRLSLAEPGTGARYGFSVAGPDRYRLCAVFATDSRDRAAGDVPEGWAHPAGPHCFERRLDADGDARR